MLNCLSAPLETWTDVRSFLDAYAIESRRPPEERPTRAGRLERMRRFMTLLGDPQNQLKVIHVAGTTGKGSTCTFIEAILRAHGYTTGLALSPHAVDVRERFQLNGAYASDEALSRVVKRLVLAVQRMQKEPCGVPGYIEFLMAAAYDLFADAHVQYAVIETGVGGRVDPSNVVRRADKLCVLTKLGYDHTNVLGERLEDIAYQKIGIVQPGNEVVIGVQTDYPASELVTLAEGAGAGVITCVDSNQSSPPALMQSVPYLRENAELALAVCQQLALRDRWVFDTARAESVLQTVSLPLRFEILNWQGKTLILDAAHNAQKMLGLVEALKHQFPRHTIAAAFALNPGTPVKEALAPLLSCVSRVACVDFIVGNGQYRFQFSDPTELATAIRALHTTFTSDQDVEVLFDRTALAEWVTQIPESMIVCTGSFHFVAALRALVLGLPEA